MNIKLLHDFFCADKTLHFTLDIFFNGKKIAQIYWSLDPYFDGFATSYIVVKKTLHNNIASSILKII